MSRAVTCQSGLPAKGAHGPAFSWELPQAQVAGSSVDVSKRTLLGIVLCVAGGRATPLRIERLAEKDMDGPVIGLQIEGLAAFGRMHKLKKAHWESM